MYTVKIGIIGDSGRLDNLDILLDVEHKEVNTLYGKAYLTVGKIKGTEVVLLASTVKNIQFPPTHINPWGVQGKC